MYQSARSGLGTFLDWSPEDCFREPSLGEALNPFRTIRCAAYSVLPAPKMPAPSIAPGLQPPAAPQTEFAMTKWSPEWQTEALGQHYVQHETEARDGAPDVAGPNDPGPPKPSTDNTMLWVLGAVAGTLFLATILRR